jgi:YidC/Oxa1 family membrane protein insertase
MSSQNDQNKSFMEPSTIMAFLLVIVFWVGWSYFMDKKYPQPTASTSATTSAAPADKPTEEQVKAATALAGTANSAAGQALQAPVQGQMPETFETYSDNQWSFQISSKGMGLKNIDVKSYKTRDEQPIILSEVSSKLSFSTYLSQDEKPIDFKIQKRDDLTYIGEASVDGMTIEKTMKLDPANYSIAVQIAMKGMPDGFKGLNTYLSDSLFDPKKLASVVPTVDRQDVFFLHDGSKTRKPIVKDKAIDLVEKDISVAALSSHYFSLALADKNSDVAPRFESNVPVGAETATVRLVYQPTTKLETFNINYTAFAGPKSFSMLSSVDERLPAIIDFGTFSVLAKPILSLMRFINSFIGNWGLAIIILTILVRLVVMPFNIYSFRSMKVMQKIQPQMKALREKYKDDAQTMNREVMLLMKQNKASPLGGCLPMLLQLPVFFALYQVLGQSIELYRSPFIFWIHDLSSKDPFYVLPVLMGITMFVNQKMTPTTMDPQQAKIMMIMPVIFTFFMVSLPSGLTLYIFISTLFGIIQQYIFLRERTKTASIKQQVQV